MTTIEQDVEAWDKANSNELFTMARHNAEYVLESNIRYNIEMSEFYGFIPKTENYMEILKHECSNAMTPEQDDLPF